jgi:hypothetical protein
MRDRGRRPGDEIASTAVFLASDLAPYITTHVLEVDGGMTKVRRLTNASRSPPVSPSSSALPPPPSSPWGRFDDLVDGTAMLFRPCERELVAVDASGVAPLLAEVEAASERGWWAFGYVAYEAAAGLDAALWWPAPQRVDRHDARGSGWRPRRSS